MVAWDNMVIRSPLSALVALVAVLGLGSVTAGLCCGPAIASVAASSMDMDMHHHGADHSTSDSSATCCTSHDTQLQPPDVVLATPEAATFRFDSDVILLPSLPVGVWSGAPVWPPGMPDLASVLCTFLI